MNWSRRVRDSSRSSPPVKFMTISAPPDPIGAPMELATTSTRSFPPAPVTAQFEAVVAATSDWRCGAEGSLRQQPEPRHPRHPTRR